MNNFKYSKITLLLAASFFAGYSNAGVVVYKNHDKVDPKVESRFSQVGISGEKAKIINGYGKNMPFSIMTDIVVPDNWDITYNEGTEKMLVNWKGYVSWPYVLKNLSEQNDVNISVNWEKKTVDFFSNGAYEDAKFEKEKLIAAQNVLLDKQKEIRASIALEKEQKENLKTTLESKIKEKELMNENASLKERLDYYDSLKSSENSKNEESLIVEKAKPKESENKSSIIEKEENKLAFLSDEEKVNLTKEYKSSFVLPLNDDLQYYLMGGYQEKIDYYTPAKFIAKSGYSIEDILNAWCKKIGFKNVKYKTRVHYTIDYDIPFEGDIQSAARTLINAYKQSKRPLDIDFFPDQKLIVVSDYSYEKNKELSTVKGE